VLIVLVRYWKISCSLDNLSCFSCSGPIALVGLIGDRGGSGDRGESSRLKVAAIGEVGIDLDSSSNVNYEVMNFMREKKRKNTHLKVYLRQRHPSLRPAQLG
jgi:hypothetical protein